MSAPTSDQRLAYVVGCLRKDPQWEADEILAARGKMLGIPIEVPAAERAAQEAQKQQRVRHTLQSVRESIWDAPAEKLNRALDRLSAEHDAGLRRAADRFRVVVASREKLTGLSSDPRFSQSFLDAYQRVISASPRVSAEVRERIVDSFRDIKNRKRGRKMIALMRARAPELCELEAGWLDHLMRQQASSPHKRNTQDAGGFWQGSWHLWWIGLVIFGRILAAIIRSQSGE